MLGTLKNIGEGLSLLRAIAQSDAVKELGHRAVQRMADQASRVAKSPLVPRFVSVPAEILSVLLADPPTVEQAPDVLEVSESERREPIELRSEAETKPMGKRYEQEAVQETSPLTPQPAPVAASVTEPLTVELKPEPKASTGASPARRTKKQATAKRANKSSVPAATKNKAAQKKKARDKSPNAG